MAAVFGHEVDQEIASRDDLRSVYKEPSVFVSNKVIDHIDQLSAKFLAHTSLGFLATKRSDGAIDITPRGDPPGFIRVLDRKTIALPDRPGNNRADAFENILKDGNIGLICVIPGHKDTLRIGGNARLVRDDKLGRSMAVKGKPAELQLLIQVQRVLCHCLKAFMRSHAWDQAQWPDTSNVPSLAAMMKAHGKLDVDVDQMAAIIKEDGKSRLY